MLRPPASGKSGFDDSPGSASPEGAGEVARAVGVGTGDLSGGGGGNVGVGGGGVGVRVGTVCRSGHCPGAAHRSEPVANPTINIPNNRPQNTYLFIAFSHRLAIPFIVPRLPEESNRKVSLSHQGNVPRSHS